MKVTTQNDYLQVIPCRNGWLLRYYEWNKEEFRWEEKCADVYQDFDVMMEVLRDTLHGD